MAITIGTVIRARRKELGMTQEELAHKIGYKSKVSVNRIEKGEQKLPSDKVGQVSAALGISPDYLYKWKDRGLTVEFEPVRETPEARNRRLIAYWLQIATPEQIAVVANMIRAMGTEVE